MPYRLPKFRTNQYYHLYNRGVEKREIFISKEDYRSFIRFMFKYPIDKKNNELVRIICYCLMPNHFHLVLQQKTPQGITKYLQKFLTAYSMYFNYIYDRVGPLYQGRTKSRIIENDMQLATISRYVHRNPLKVVSKYEDILTYSFSSFPFYMKQAKARYTKILSLFNNDPKIYRSFTLFDSPAKSPDLPI